MPRTVGPDYPEILRLYRKYRARDGEALWEVFVRIGRELEGASKKERCRTCHYTDLGYSRLVDPFCNDPWHGDEHLRTSSLTSNAKDSP
jgi:hypothetical protein